jgi:hypothetical protein
MRLFLSAFIQPMSTVVSPDCSTLFDRGLVAKGDSLNGFVVGFTSDFHLNIKGTMMAITPMKTTVKINRIYLAL